MEILADAAEDLLPPAEAAAVADHLRDCTACADLAQRVTDVSQAVREHPVPAMPPAVSRRLTDVVRAEAQRRASGISAAEESASLAEAAKRTDLGTFRQNPVLDRATRGAPRIVSSTPED